MKKTIYQFLSLLLSVALLSLAACSKEEPPIDEPDPNDPAIVDPGENGMIINAICAPFEEESRATVGENGAVTWDEFDRIGLFEFVGSTRQNGNIRFVLEEGVGEATGKFSSNSELDTKWSTGERTIYAYYPYQPGSVMAKALPMSLPVEIEYDSQNPIEHLNASNIMIAKAELSSTDPADEITLNFNSLLSPITLYVENKTEEPFELFYVKVKCSDNSSIFPKEASLNLPEMQLISAFAELSPDFTVNLKEPISLQPEEGEEIPLFLYPLNLENGADLVFEVGTSRKPVIVPANFLKGFQMKPAEIYVEELDITEEIFGLLGVEELPGDTNCHLINPPTVDGTSMRYLLPISRVNEFWGENSHGDPANVIDADTKWIAEILWKDVDIDGDIDLISFTSKGATGIGPDAMMQIEVNCDLEEPYGNALIAIKKADDNYNPVGDYLWSWHIWISDYNGELFDLSNGEYNKVMDRNLGARSGIWGHPGSMGLLYQWGRKDPFVGAEYAYWLGGG
ncbi:MAG: fimbrillin family protein, partial [Bacteroidales bacterium]